MQPITRDLVLGALKPLGPFKRNHSQLKFNCPICEKSGSAVDKFNLEVKISTTSGYYHCWACNYKGTLYKLVKEYGYKEYLHLFDTRPQIEKDEDKEKKIFELPQYVFNVLNHQESTDYLLSRGLTKEKIREREIKYCYSGLSKDGIIFPSYNLNGELTAYVVHFPKLKKYYVHKKENFVCFYESFIDKHAPIILTEGVYDALVVPNAIPTLGTSLLKGLQTFLTNTEVIYIPDTDVKASLLKQTIRVLSSVCKQVHFHILERYKDVNEAFTQDKVVFTDSLRQFYLIKN